MTEEVQDGAQQEPLPFWMFECERDPPISACSGFTLCGGLNIFIRFAYVIYPMGVVLVAVIQMGEANPSVWRRFWTSKEAAVGQAAQLVADAEDYLYGSLNLAPRQDEDLDGDSFVHHLDMRINNGFH